jgi:hypothetical protein
LAGQALRVSHIVIFLSGAYGFCDTVASGIVPVAHGVAAFGNACYLAVYRPVDPGYALRYIAYKIAGMATLSMANQLLLQKIFKSD